MHSLMTSTAEDAYAPGECDLEMLIADLRDAFWLIPLRMSERGFFIIKDKGIYMIVLRTGQGSLGARLSWAAVAVMIARNIRSVSYNV